MSLCDIQRIVCINGIESTGQDKLLEKLKAVWVGRCILRPLVSPVVSKLGGRILDSRISVLAVEPLSEGMESIGRIMKKKNIFHIMIYKETETGCTWEMDMDERHFISPCDCRLSVYPIEPQMEVTIKNTCYTVGSLLRDERLAEHFKDGYLWVFRLSARLSPVISM